MIINIPTYSGVKFINDQDIAELRPAEYLCANNQTIKGCDVFLSNGRCIQSSFTATELQKYINQQLQERL